MVMKIHITPGVDSAAAARDFMEYGTVGIDDFGGNLYDTIWDNILEILGHAADDLIIKEQRISTRLGPVFVLRDASR